MSPSRLTIDQLAHQEGLPTSTIRLYVQEGLLPRPDKEGRRAFYLETHVTRLRSIRRLLERGFSLAAIKQLFELDDRGEGLTTLLHDDMHETVDLDPAEFARLFSDGEIEAGLVQKAVELGVLTFDESGIRFTDRRHLTNALALAELGVSGAAGLETWKKTRALMGQVIAGFVDLAATTEDEHDPEFVRRLLALGLESVVLAYQTELEALVGASGRASLTSKYSHSNQ